MNVLIVGRIGMKQGKTTLALYLARQHSAGVVVWDPRHMIEGGVIITDPEQLEEAIQDKLWLNGPIIYRPNGLDIKGAFHEMASVLFSPPERFGRFSLVVDEASQLQTSHGIDPFLDVAIRQHPRSVLLVQTTHSLQDFGRASRDLMNDLYCFRLQGRSLDSVIDYADGSEELRETILTLPDHHVVHIDFTGARGAEYIVIDDPASWFTPLSERAEEEGSQAPDIDGEISVQQVEAT